MVKSAERVAQILRTLSDAPDGLLYSDLQRSLDLPKSSVHALLDTLVTTRMASFDEQNKRYILGPLLWELAMSYSNQLQLVPLALPHLQTLRDAFGETVQLAILESGDVLYVAKVASLHPVQLVSNVGSRLPAYATGIGKALLAALPSDEVKNIYPVTELPQFTPHTHRTTEQLARDLDAIRQRGYSIDQGEYSPGVYCLAIPVLDADNKPKAAISISMPVERHDASRDSLVVDRLTAESSVISHKLGSINPSSWRIATSSKVTQSLLHDDSPHR